MANASFDIPNELRDFAERSVDQARKAFEGFISVAQKAVGAIDDDAATTQNNPKLASAQAFRLAEQSVNAAFDFAHKFVQAKDAQEACALHSEFVMTQLDALQAQAKELGAFARKGATPSAK